MEALDYKVKQDYFLLVSKPGMAGGGVICDEPTGLVTSFCIGPVEPPDCCGTTFKISTITIKEIINAQVPFSRKSPVRCTPITLFEPAKPDERPPPLGF